MGKRGSHNNVVDSVNGSGEAWAYRSMRVSRGSELTNAIKLRQSTRTAPVGENSSYGDENSSNQSQTQGDWRDERKERGKEGRKEDGKVGGKEGRKMGR